MQSNFEIDDESVNETTSVSDKLPPLADIVRFFGVVEILA